MATDSAKRLLILMRGVSKIWKNCWRCLWMVPKWDNQQISKGQESSFLTDYLLIILKALVLSILKTLIQCHIQGQLLSNYLFYPLNPLLFSFPSFKTCITWLDSKMCYSLKKDPGIKFGKLRMMRHDFDSRQYWPKSLYV